MKMCIYLEIELDDELWGFKNNEEREWFRDEVMKPSELVLHSNEVGDEIGKILRVEWNTYENR